MTDLPQEERLKSDQLQSLTECEQALTDAARSVTLHDARGAEHRVIDVEFGPEKKAKQGGTTRALTLVTN